MSAKDLQMLIGLRNSEAYKMLVVLQMQKVTNVEIRRDSAAARSQESAWRYYAGQEKGFKDAMMTLDEEIIRLEAEGGEASDQPSEQIERLLNEARGKAK